MPSKPKFVSLEEFGEMITASGALNVNIVNKDFGKYYNLSLETEVDELEMEKHMQMFKLEFYEAVARVADKIEFDPNKNLDGFNLYTDSEKVKSRRNTKGTDLIDSDSHHINIEGAPDSKSDSKSDSSSSSDYAIPEDATEMVKSSTLIELKDLNLGRNKDNNLAKDDSAWSLGDCEKLYQKLEKFIKNLVHN